MPDGSFFHGARRLAEPVTVHRFTITDVPAIRQAVAVVQAAHRRPDGTVPQRFEWAGLFDQLYDAAFAQTPGHARFLVARLPDSGDVVGVFAYRPAWCSASGWELAYLAVSPDWQGRGVGTALIRGALSAIAREGRDGDFIIVRAARPAAFQRMGFSPCLGDPQLLVGKVGALAVRTEARP